MFDLKLLGERTIRADCDVIQADGGARTAAITGAWVALRKTPSPTLLASGKIAQTPLLQPVAAISVGIVQGTPLLDLEYVEDVDCIYGHERGDDQRRPFYWKCKARPKGLLSAGPRWTNCSPWQKKGLLNWCNCSSKHWEILEVTHQLIAGSACCISARGHFDHENCSRLNNRGKLAEAGHVRAAGR